jgi:type IV pilus assembly protein PilW
MMKGYMPNKQKGFSLIELMIGMLLGLFLVLAITVYLVSSKSSYVNEEELSRVQENARFAMELLAQDIRNVGYGGCALISSVTPNVIADPGTNGAIEFDTDSVLEGYDHVSGTTWNPALPSYISSSVNANTDAIYIQYATACDTYLVGNLNSVNANIQIFAPNDCDLSAGDIVVISDCEATDVFRATNVSNGPSKETIAHANNMNSTNKLSKPYQQDAELLGLTSKVFYISDNANGIPSLYQYDPFEQSAAAEELVEGIENMQLRYGVDTDGDGNAEIYQTGNQLENNASYAWSDVVSVRVSVLARSLIEAANESETYWFDGASVASSDLLLRREFMSTIKLRNRGN